jgi:hypothetical protein
MYPAMTQYDETSLYDAEGFLTDLLFDETTLSAHEPLSLNLKHRFARVVMKMDGETRAKVDSVVLRVKGVVTEVSPASGEMTVDGSRWVSAAIGVGDDDADIAFIVPSEHELQLILGVTLRNGRIEEEKCFGPFRLEANVEYGIEIHSQPNYFHFGNSWERMKLLS